MKIVIISDHLEYQKKTPSIKWVYNILSHSSHTVKYISTGLSLSRLAFRRIGLRDFFFNCFSSNSPIKFAFPIYPILNRFTKWYFIRFWSSHYIRIISKFQPDIILVESGIPSIILYSIFHKDSLKNIRKVYRISDVTGSFRYNPVLKEIDNFILHNRREYNCLVSAPTTYKNIFPDQILRPGVPLYALNQSKALKEKLIVYVGVYPLPYKFVDEISRAYPEYKVICTCEGKSHWSNVEFIGIIEQIDIERIIRKASIGIMFFPSGVSDWFLASSNKLALYNAFRIPVISNNCGVNLRKYCIYNIREGFGQDQDCKTQEVYSWEQYVDNLINLC
jgi:hypothetical protein